MKYDPELEGLSRFRNELIAEKESLVKVVAELTAENKRLRDKVRHLEMRLQMAGEII